VGAPQHEGDSRWHYGNSLILRRPRGGRLEGRTAIVQIDFQLFHRSFVGTMPLQRFLFGGQCMYIVRSGRAGALPAVDSAAKIKMHRSAEALGALDGGKAAEPARR
jgi:hypothetical protein